MAITFPFLDNYIILPRFLKKTRNDYFLLCGLFSIPVFYFFYFYQDLCLGPRFLYSAVPFAILLTARALPLTIAEISRRRCCPLQQSRGAVLSILLVSVLFSATVRMPRLIHFYGDSFWEVDNRLMEKIESLGIKNAVVFQKSYGLKGNCLGSGFLHNSPWLDTSIVFAKDLGNRNAELIPFFPGRRYYLASRDTSGAIVISPLHINTFPHSFKN